MMGGEDRGQGVQPEQLERMAAPEAVAALTGDFAEDMPRIGAATFPGPVAEAFFASDATIAGIAGPVGSGKTTTLLVSRMRRALAMPRSTLDGVRRYRLVVARETYRQLWTTAIPSYLEVYPRKLGQWSGGRGDPVSHTILFQDGWGPIEWETQFLAFGDNIVASMRGLQATDLWLNEADTVPYEVLGVGIGRIGRFPGQRHFEGYPPAQRGYGQIVTDQNAPDEDNWTYGFYYDTAARERLLEAINRGRPEGLPPVTVAFFNQPGWGEPGVENLQNLPPGYYEGQIAANALGGRSDLTQRLVQNRVTFLRAGEPVFKAEFNPRIHVAPAPLAPWDGVPLRIGLDQGFKGAAVVAQFDAPGCWQVLAELHFPNERLLAAEFGRRLAQLLDDPRFRGLPVLGGWGDMAGEHGASAAADENDTWNLLVSRAAGITIRPQRIGTNRLQPRLEAVRAALTAPLHAGEPRLVIDPSCRMLRRGFEARYVWTDEITPSGDKRKVPDKRLTEANVMDALQYLLLSEVLGTGESPLAAVSTAHPAGRRDRNPDHGRDGPGLVTTWDVLGPMED